MKIDCNIRNGVRALFTPRLIDAKTGAVVKEFETVSNLVFDTGLTDLAGGTGFAGGFAACKCGSGTNPNSFYNASITFSQTASTTLVASAPFFTAAMVGGIFKYGHGTGGVEYYIVSYTDSTHVVVDTSTTTSGQPGTVWMVQQSALQTYQFVTTTCKASANGTVYSTNVCTQTRVFDFAVQGSTYSVNELGWGSNAGNNSTVSGRTVLASTVSVPPSQYLEVTVQITFTVSPVGSVSVGNVGTGIDSSGVAGINTWDIQAVDVNGNSVVPTNGNRLLDGNSGIALNFINNGAPPAIHANPSTTLGTAPDGSFFGNCTNLASWTTASQPVGVAVANISWSLTVVSGQVISAIAFCRSGGAGPQTAVYSFVIVLNTQYVFSSTLFTGSAVVSRQYTRTLTNP